MRKYFTIAIVAVLAVIAMLLLSHPDDLQQYPVTCWSDYHSLTQQDDGSYTFQVSMDQFLSTDDTLAVRSSLQAFTASVDGEVVYQYLLDDSQPFGAVPPSRWHFISIPQASDGLITFTYSGAKMSYQTPMRIYHGQHTDLLLYVTQISHVALIFSIIALIAGCFMLVGQVLLSHKASRQLLYMGIFLLLFGLWSWGESKTYYFNYTSLFWQSQITYLCVFLMPIPLSLSNRIYCTPLLSRINNGYIKLVWVCAITGVLLQISNIMDCSQFLVVTQLLLLIGSILVFTIRVNWILHAKNRHEIGLSAAFIILVLSVLIEVYFYLSGNLLATGTAARIGVFALVLVLCYYEFLSIRLERAESLALKLEMEQASAGLMSSQMKPHFVHNTLLAIQDCCYRDPKLAYEAIGDFSQYMRASLEGTGGYALIPFSAELDHVNLYVRIQKLCYGDAIDYTQTIRYSHFNIPPFSIQPLVENAIVHGIRKRRGTGSVHLNVWEQDNNIMISITDNGVGFTPTVGPKTTFSSTAAVIYRIEKLLDGTVTIASVPGEGTCATITLPKQSQEVDA